MHPALALPELLRMICAEMNSVSSTADQKEQRESKTKNRVALASVARVCHAFKDPALDVLWSDVDQVHSLLHLFPSRPIFYDGAVWATNLCSLSPGELEKLYN